MAHIHLDSISVPVINIINRFIPEDGELNLEICRSYKKDDLKYIGTCAAQLYFKEDKRKEENFFVEVEISGIFSSDSDNISDEYLKDYIIKTLLPHLNAVLSSAMAIAAVPPSLIPTNLLANFNANND